MRHATYKCLPTTYHRTSSRTQYYVDAEMTALIRPRFPEELMEAVRATAPETEVHGIHDNWKIARYQAGQAFPAHFDQGTRDSAMTLFKPKRQYSK